MNAFLQLPTFARLAAGAIALGCVFMMPPAVAQTATTATPAENTSVANAVVKVFTTSRNPDPFKPWAKQSPSESTGTGVLIDGNRILTNAHVVRYASQVQVQPNQSGEKFTATVVAIAQGIDLAILKLDDESVFKGRTPLGRTTAMPEIKDAVLAYGFPTGGTSLSITKGIVSRIEFAGYNAPVSGLRIQIDAAINPGNSGGPAVAGDKMIGLAFSTLTNAQNIGYIIPNEEIELFLKDVADGRYDGKPTMHDELQTLENPALRTFLKLDKAVKGIVVHRPYSTDAAYPLKKWDVITHVDGTPVDDQGMVKAGSELRLNLRYLIQKQAKNGRVPLTVVRESKPLQISLPVSAERPMLIPDLKGDYPSYFVYGPVVFSKATAQFNAFLFNSVGTIAGFSFVKSPLVLRRGDEPDAQNDELVVISSPFFTHKLSVGYSNPALQVVEFVNGTRIKSLGQLVALLRDMKSEFVTIETANRGGETLVFPHKDMVAAVEDILNDNGVRVQGTPDTMTIWKGTAKP